MSSFADLHAVVDELRAGLKSEARLTSQDPKFYLDYLEPAVYQAISSLEMVSAKDGTVLACISKRLPSQALFKAILPAVKSSVNHVPMAMAFLTEFFDGGVSDELTENVAHTIFKDVVSDLVDRFSLQNLDQTHGISKRKATTSSWIPVSLSQTMTEVAPDRENSKNAAALLCNCLSLGLETELDQIMTKTIEELSKAPLDLFEIIYLPLLKTLIEMLRERGISGKALSFQRVFKTILATYIIRYVQHEPVPPKNWTRPPVKCCCSDCQNLNAYLGAPDQKVGRFAVNKKRREHLDLMLNFTSITSETERRGSPQALVITKNLDRHRGDHKAWEQRRAKAQKHIQDLGPESLKKFLAEMYDPVLALAVDILLPAVKGLLESTRPALPVPLDEVDSNDVLRPITKRKIPAEVEVEVVVLSD